MRSRPTFWILLGLLCVAGAWLFWPHAGRRAAQQNSPAQNNSIATPGAATTTSTATAPDSHASPSAAAARTNKFAYRLSNTSASLTNLMNDRHAILLENALIDTSRPLNFSIPKQLQSAGDPGAYIVQARGPADAAFRAVLLAAGAKEDTFKNFIPNNAFLAQLSPGAAAALKNNPLVQAVIPYEPYYKIINPSLLGAAVRQKVLPDGAALTLGLFSDNAAATVAQIEKMGGTILAADRSPFGPMVRVAPPQNWTALAALSGVQIVEPYHVRVRANDLSRATTGVASDSTTSSNYLNLTGLNVLVAVDDSGVDATHPDLTGRVFGAPAELTDTAGHGTHVAGIIAGDGTESLTVTNASGSVMPATNGQFRGKAPLAKLFAMDFQDSDQNLQAGAALTNALISNNSWNFDGDTLYDLEAASYDAATRDALPTVTGSQPVLFVFSAGNSGGGGDDGVGGAPGSILSPATAKDVITVGALEQLRDITNLVTDASGNSNAVWFGETDSSNQVAGFSSRGNVGIGTEGLSGRYKPDVVAPGVFAISTRSQEWDEAAYYFQNPTNDNVQAFRKIIIQPGGLFENSFPLVPDNAVQVTIQVVPNADSPSPFPVIPIFMGLESSPNVYDYETTNNLFSIPPDGPGLPAIIADQNLGFNYAVSNNTANAINIDIITDIVTTNATGNEGLVLSNLNDSIGSSPYYYRYESGTSMAAPDVSGMLALIQDYFTNTLHAIPSPALLKALLINGARPVGNYNFSETDGRNYQGWGLINLPNSVPAGSTNQATGSNSVFFIDQSPTNALATGDSHTFLITVPTNSTTLPLRVTLAWTDPAGNPAAAIKLVNNLDLVVTNTATNNIVYYGNDFPPGSIYNSPGNTNAPNLDTINPEENVYLLPPLAGTYSVTVVGRGVNVNAVTAQTNNVVQDYALVISCGDGLTPGAITVTDGGGASTPTSGQLITGVIATNSPLFNQYAGANPPLLGTNTVAAGGNTAYATNAVVTVGMTNQWHFYVVTNLTGFANAAFITFLPPTLSIPRMGVFADSDANPTTPQSDIDLYVAGPGDPNASALTNLDPTVIANCVHGLTGDGSSLSRGGTEFVVYTNSAAGQVYYIGVKAEDQMASEYAFLPVFTQTPFSQLNPDGSQTVNGFPLPVAIPDGSPAHPGSGFVFGVALYPMQIQNVTVSNQITHQNFGDLIGTLTHNDQTDVLNNHNSLSNPSGIYNFIYDDSQNPVANSQPSDGPGSLVNFAGEDATGLWQLTEVDDSQSQTGAVTGFSLNIQPYQDPTKGVVTVSLAPGEFFTSFVDVPVGATNLTIFATNITDTASQPVELFVRYNFPPTQSNFDAMTPLDKGHPPSGLISISATNQPPLRSGRYFFSLFNPLVNPTQVVQYFATIGVPLTGPTPLDFNSAGPTPLPDDAVTTSSISVPDTDPISAVNVGIRVEHPRISDLIFHLISPDGSRFLLMENRGAYTTNGAGASYFTTNTTSVPHNGDNQAYTNTIDTGTTSGTITINYDFFTLPDSMDVYYQGAQIFSYHPAFTGQDISGTTNLAYGPGTSTDVTIIMNAGGNTNFPTTAWTYSVTSTTAKYSYLTFDEDTNLTTTPIKFAPTPFTPVPSTITNLFVDSFETNVPGVYTNGQKIGDFNEWTVTSNSVTVVSDPTNAASGLNYVALGNGIISTILPTVRGQPYIFQYSYRGADLSIVGGVEETSVAASTNWQTHFVQFIAAQTGTPVSIQGTGPGALLDNITFTELPPTLYYLPEQSLTPLVGLSPAGIWQMEVQDNRVGAYDSNNVPLLLDWQLEFVLAQTNALLPPVFTNPPANLTMDEQTVIFVTNSAVAASTNLTLTYSLLNPPADGWVTIDPNTGIIRLAPQEVDGPTNWTVITIVTDNGSPSLSANNSFVVTVNEVNRAPRWPPGIPSQGNYNITALNTLTVTNTATDPDIPVNPLTYQLLVSLGVTNAAIDTNGIINWTPTLAQATNIYTFETIVTDTNVFALTNQSLSATNFFTVAVLPPLTLTNGGPFTNIVAPGGINWFLVNVPTNADFATNSLLFASGPLNVWFSTNSPPTITNLNDYVLIPNATSGVSVLSLTSSPTNIVPGAAYFLGVQNPNSFPVTNAIEVDFHFRSLTNTAPFWIANPPTNRIAILTTLVVTNTATDTDSPPNTLTYQLLTPPANAVINPVTGIITFTPTAAQGNTTNTIITIVTDNGSPPLSATNSFIVIVRVPPFSATLAATAVTGTNAQLNGFATPNGSPAVAWFEWGVNSRYGNRTTNVNVGSGKSVVYVTNRLAGLTLLQAYHYRLVTSNSIAVAYGFDQIFDVGGVTTWGNSGAGLTNVPAILTNTAVAIAGGTSNSLALMNNGRPIAWGDNSSTQTNVPANVTNAVAIASGSTFNLALRNNGRVVGWGNNSFGQTNVPAAFSNVVAIAAGEFHGLALRTNGIVVAWGTVGIVSTITNVPVGLSNVVAVAAGGLHSLALKNDGTVVAWGVNAAGQTNVPAGLNSVAAIAAGGSHSLALKTNGTVVAWGLDTSGQTNVPPGLSNVVAIAAGVSANFSLALKSDGTVVAWGDDTSGQTNVPASVTNVAAIAGGGQQSLALVSLTPVNLFNTAPFFLATPANQAINVLVSLMVTNTAKDLDVPTNILTYALLNPPASAAIDPGTGIITFTPAVAQANTTNIITTIVTDNGVPPLSATNSFSIIVYPIPAISSIIFTNLGGFNGYLLQWYAPTNDRFQVQWTPNLTPPVNWHTFTNIIAYTGPLTPTNGLFTFFDDGSQTGGFDPQRFYRLILLGSAASANMPPVLPPQAARTVTPLSALIVTNTATDADIPAQTLTYTLSSTLGGTNAANINASTGVITWTPTLAQAGLTNILTTIVTDNGAPPLSATNSFSVIVNPIPSISSVTFTNLGGFPGYLLQWYAPTNDRFQVQWTASLAPASWQTFSNIITYPGPLTPTNGLFTFFDDGSQTGGFGSQRFYRLILLGSASSPNTPPVLPSQAVHTVTPQSALIVTNTATDSDVPAQTLTYTLSSTLGGANAATINPGTGIITWTPTLAQAGTTNTFTTIVTDNGVPPMSATNSFFVAVNPIPVIGSVSFTTNGLNLQWSAPTNDQFNVRWTTNLVPPVTWTLFPGIITSTNGTFNFTDTNAPLFMKFYELILLP